MDPIFNNTLSEINDQSEFQAGDSQISQSLGFEKWVVIRCRFNLNDDLLINQNIHPERSSQNLTFIMDRYLDLPPHV